MKNILIIGGSYFVGRVFVEELIKEDGYSICVVNRGNVPLNMEGVDEIVCDRNDVDGLHQELPRLDWCSVVDFCAYGPRDIKNLFSVLPEGSFRQYIYISTTSIYKDTLQLPIREDAPKLTGPQPELGPQMAIYAFNKWLAELELMKQCSQLKCHYTCLRPAIIYGKYNYAPRESWFFDMIHQNKTIVLPDNELALFQFVSVWDVAKIIVACLGNEKVFNKVFNLAAEDLVSYRRFVEVLREITGKKITIRGESIETIDQQRIPLPFPLDKHLIYSGDLIQQILGFQYIPFNEGMKQTYEYYKQMGPI